MGKTTLITQLTEKMDIPHLFASADAGNTTTPAHYLQLPDTAGLLGGIEKFDRKAIRKRSSSPKFQVHNTALISA